MYTDHRRLGAQGPQMFPIALGCSAMSGRIGQVMDDVESTAARATTSF